MKYLIAAALVVGTCALVYAHDHHDEQHGDDHHTHPKYEFEYGVKDTKTGDIKDQWEHRDGDHVKGAYSLKESDGTTRVVKYHANDHSGFHAEVKKIGHAHHPETPHHGHDDHQHGHNDHHHGHDDHHHGHDDHHHEAHHDHHDGHHEVHHDDHHDAHHHHDDHHDDAHHHGHDHGHGHATSYANIHQHH